MSSPTADRIVAVARSVLVEEGVGAVSMRRIATAVGITPMAIYRHFPNREALLDTIANISFAELGEKWANPGLNDNFDALITRSLNQYLDFALGEPNLYFFLFTEHRDQARRFPADFADGASPTFNLLISGINAAIRVGLLPEDEDVLPLALILAAELHGLVQLYHGGRIGMPEPEFREFCHRAVRRILNAENTR
ncbi:MAG TPA: TetR/AcrR family transcriptional regulator [Pseudonocardiaceae bacterium]|nr:TetR/AcrR family transcriptional regulator [Pseudonocardiaceae bacterium]